MLITNLGKTRASLLASLAALPYEALNQVLPGQTRSIAQIVHHLSATESETAQFILRALPRHGETVDECGEAAIIERMARFPPAAAPATRGFTLAELIGLLEQSRFRDLQRVFNETHTRVLAAQSARHPVLGRISLKNLVDFIWIHEARHTRQIEELKARMRTAPRATPR